mmetsp:Transcript_73972/g.208536  ORF Transcript_73972/g.208536 Transcript_73972/m.208536 type:complete len:254 (+) Transcript_73972:94-855(+)
MCSSPIHLVPLPDAPAQNQPFRTFPKTPALLLLRWFSCRGPFPSACSPCRSQMRPPRCCFPKHLVPLPEAPAQHQPFQTFPKSPALLLLRWLSCRGPYPSACSPRHPPRQPPKCSSPMHLVPLPGEPLQHQLIQTSLESWALHLWRRPACHGPSACSPSQVLRQRPECSDPRHHVTLPEAPRCQQRQTSLESSTRRRLWMRPACRGPHPSLCPLFQARSQLPTCSCLPHHALLVHIRCPPVAAAVAAAAAAAA